MAVRLQAKRAVNSSYKEISPNSILVHSGQTTVADLFYNMTSKTVGLVGMWDCVAVDEVASITFKDKDGVQIIQGGGKLIPAGIANPSTIFTMSHAKSSLVGVYRLETQMLPGNGKHERTGLGTDQDAKEATQSYLSYS